MCICAYIDEYNTKYNTSSIFFKFYLTRELFEYLKIYFPIIFDLLYKAFFLHPIVCSVLIPTTIPRFPL